MSTICRTGTNPAVGSKGLIGYAQEGCWGSQIATPRKYVDMLNESMVSEIGSLISASLRPDRAVHKRIGGTEAAGGDINIEIGPTGYGSWIKHALGNCQTTRVDEVFIVTVQNASAAALTINHTNGEATDFFVEITGAGDNFYAVFADATCDTIGELMALINACDDLTAYSPYSYRNDATPEITLQTEDYTLDADVPTTLEAYAAIDMMGHADDAWVICHGWGVYSHQIDGHEEVPEGCSILVGRDVAAFLYSGCRVNTMAMNAVPSEIFTGTFGWMSKGGTTVGAISAVTGTGHEKNAFDMRYTGDGANCTCTIVNGVSATLEIDSATGSEDFTLNLETEYVDPDTGRVWAVNKMGGLMEFLKSKSYLYVDIAPFVDWETPSIYLKAAGGTDIDVTAANIVTFDFLLADLDAFPVLWGDYIGSDSGTAATLWVRVVNGEGGVPGTAQIEFSTDGVTYHNAAVTSATLPTEIRTGAGNTDTGFTIFFPDDTALIADDVWSFETFYTPPAAADVTYASDQDPFSGFEGALTMDDASQPIMGWTTTLNNNLFGDKYHLGERVRGMLPAQQRSIEGTLTVEFDDLDLYRKFINGTPADLEVVFTSSDKVADTYMGDSKTDFSLTVRQPNMEFNGATPVIGGMEIITVDMPYVALWDDTNSLPDMRITLVNDVPYL